MIMRRVSAGMVARGPWACIVEAMAQSNAGKGAVDLQGYRY